jgi:hypothetical protein
MNSKRNVNGINFCCPFSLLSCATIERSAKKCSQIIADAKSPPPTREREVRGQRKERTATLHNGQAAAEILSRLVKHLHTQFYAF